MVQFAFAVWFSLVVVTWAADPPLTVAVLEFQAGDFDTRHVAENMSALLAVEFSQDEHFLTVERAELDKSLCEQVLGVSGVVSEASAAKVGQLTGARLLVVGRALKVDRDTVVIAKLISVETSRVFSEKVTLPPGGSSQEAAGKLAHRLAAAAASHRDALVAKGDDGARLAAVQKALEGKGRETVSVTIPEQHFGRPVIDPAAETEMGLLLQQCEFPLVDGRSAAKPAIEIVGEAFSERGVERSGLIACRARVEIKARRVADGAILAVDRQTGVAVDISEHVAAKRALQMASRELTLRLLPQLAH